MTKNIVLIGMPGSGKTTIGRQLSQSLAISFVDLDEEIEKHSKQTIPALFEKGESHFREVESEVTAYVSKKTPLILATGGGVVLRKENIQALRENGCIIFLNRSLENIAGDVEMSSRPLLKDGLSKLEELYNERIDLYRQYADLTIENNTSPDAAVKEIVKQLEKNQTEGQ